jgi:hypothetical protein
VTNLGRKKNYLAPIIVMAVILSLVLAFNMGLDVPLGLDPALAVDLAAVMPGIFFFTLCAIDVAFSASGSPMKILGVACMGVSMAVLLEEMHGVAIINDAMLLPATLIQFQAISIILGLLLGGVVYAGGGD